MIVESFSAGQGNLRLDSDDSSRGFNVTCWLHFNNISLASNPATAINGSLGATKVIMIYNPTLISPCELMRIWVTVLFFETSKSNSSFVGIFRLVTVDDGGRDATLKGCGTVGVVVEDQRDQGTEGW